MNCLLITLGSRGDIDPFISIGLALKNRGYQVTIISFQVFDNLVLEAGLNFIACGSKEEYLQSMSYPDSSSGHKKNFQFIADNIFFRSLSTLYNIIAKFDSHDTILVSRCVMFGARLAQEKLGFSLVSVCIQPSTLWSVEKPAVAPDGTSLERVPLWLRKIVIGLGDRFLLDKILSQRVNKFRFELGLPRIKNIFSSWRYSTQKVIGLFPEWFAPQAQDWPKQTELVGFACYNEVHDWPLSNEVLRFIRAGQPPLVITFGTSHMQGGAVQKSKEFFQISLSAVRALGYRCLLLTSDNTLLPVLDREKELHVTYLSFKALFPHVAALIHPGGIGTMAQAITTGLPQLLVPTFNDQPDNAARLNRLELGISVPFKKYTIETATSALRELLASAEIKENCLRYSKMIDFEHAEQRVCDIVGEIVETSVMKS